MVIGVVAVAPHADVAVIVAVPEAPGVAEITLPARINPAGKSAAEIVEPSVAVMVETNGRPTVPIKVSATIAGAVHAAIVTESVACAPQAAVTVIVAVPAAVGVPEMMLPLSERPAGNWATGTAAPQDGARGAGEGKAQIPPSTSAARAGTRHARQGEPYATVPP